jgi:N-acetylglucosamine-6-sulfatase
MYKSADRQESGSFVTISRGYVSSFKARRRTLSAVLACLSAFLLLFVAGCSGSEASVAETSQGEEAEAPVDRPNIIFILTDDLDSASVQKMPQITSLLADQGTSFDDAFVSHSLCCPSRSTILTGLYDHNHNVLSNKPPDGGFEKFLSEGHEEDTIGVGLQGAGYQTAFFGKYLNGYPVGDPTHVPPGWDEWYGKLDGQKLYNYGINENGEEVSYGSETEDFFTDVLAGQTTDFIERAAPDSRPFFMYVAPTAPHGPATPAERHKGAFSEEEPYRPPSFDEKDVSDKPSQIRDTEPISEEDASKIDDRYRQRLESMLAVDDMVGSLIQELETAGELDNTFIFFTSDNGFEQGEHRLQKGKNQAYEESSHVPLLVRGPGVPAGVKTEKLAVNTDFAPTFADLAGAEFRADGRSLVPALAENQDPSWRTSVLLERLPTQSGYRAVRTETHKYVEYNNGDKELYDLRADPYELDDIYDSADPALLEDLKARLEALKNCSEEGCREAEDAQ